MFACTILNRPPGLIFSMKFGIGSDILIKSHSQVGLHEPIVLENKLVTTSVVHATLLLLLPVFDEVLFQIDLKVHVNKSYPLHLQKMVVITSSIDDVVLITCTLVIIVIAFWGCSESSPYFSTRLKVVHRVEFSPLSVQIQHPSSPSLTANIGVLCVITSRSSAKLSEKRVSFPFPHIFSSISLSTSPTWELKSKGCKLYPTLPTSYDLLLCLRD